MSVSACLSASISQKQHSQTSPSFMCVLPVAMGRSFFGCVAISVVYTVGKYLMYFRFCELRRILWTQWRRVATMVSVQNDGGRQTLLSQCVVRLEC